jgi:hypothetical protein
MLEDRSQATKNRASPPGRVRYEERASTVIPIFMSFANASARSNNALTAEFAKYGRDPFVSTGLNPNSYTFGSEIRT